PSKFPIAHAKPLSFPDRERCSGPEPSHVNEPHGTISRRGRRGRREFGKQEGLCVRDREFGVALRAQPAAPAESATPPGVDRSCPGLAPPRTAGSTRPCKHFRERRSRSSPRKGSSNPSCSSRAARST